MIFPWQKEQWQWFLRAQEAQRLPHALLLTGIAGLGKAKFADTLTRALLCLHEKFSESAACVCHACCLIQGRVHPNVLWVEPEKTGQMIKVDQIRMVSEFINHSALQNGYRIVVIHSANDMNISAANALLKTLEEPTLDAMLILISNQSSHLPATILSRCQRLVFPKPKKPDALLWLKDQLSDPELVLNLAHGAPLAALDLAKSASILLRQDVFQILFNLRKKPTNLFKAVSKIQEMDILKTLDFILSLMIDLHRLQLGGDEIINKDYANELQELKQQTELKANTKLLEHVQATRAQICNGFNLNKQLIFEDILFQWCI